MSNIYHSFPGRITAETFKKQITTVVDIWEDWIVFPPDFTTELRERLDGTLMGAHKRQVEEDVMGQEVRPVTETQAPRFKMSSFKPATAAAHDDGEPMDQGSDNDIDGVPLPVGGDDDVNGQPIEDDIDGVPIDDDIDGVPIDDNDNVDGEPMDDMDGEPMDEGGSVDGRHVDT
jgi:U2-associated protein SR140